MSHADIIAKTKNISSSVHFGTNVKINAHNITISDGAHIGNNAQIYAINVTIGDHAWIGDNVIIYSDIFTIGFGSTIDDFCEFKSLDGKAAKIHIGDNSIIYSCSNIIVPELIIGDYVKVHNHNLINGLKPCYIGHNSWIGQNCILNSNDTLFVGNNVGIGPYCSIWTHGFFGELLEGFPFTVAPTVIEDNVWIVGAYNVVFPGVTLGNGCMILPSSVVTTDILSHKTAAGTPAKVLRSDKLQKKQYSLDDKVIHMKNYIREYLNINYEDDFQLVNDIYHVTPKNTPQFTIEFVDEYSNQYFADDCIQIIYAKRSKELNYHHHITVFDLSTKQYTKRLTEPEIEIIKFMTSYRARFVPEGSAIVGVKPK